MINKGYVSSILDGGKTVTVVPAFSGDVVTHPLKVPVLLQGTMAINKEVIYCTFPDNTGAVLANMDGEWSSNVDAGEAD